ncbi:MAG: GxxExxY protein [Candidatus Cloacimonetes bacterium]|nr:GxxExxY protein [Candidatus Cloacimonadota bacterium]
MSKLLYPELSYKIVGLAMEVHSKLGPGFLEKVYENALMLLFDREGVFAQEQQAISVHFEEQIVGNYICDILVENDVIFELKTVDAISDIHRAQVINYLKATGKRLGIILNFKTSSLKYERIVV